MFIDIDRVDSIRYDVCVVGAGPAGIILALEYSRKAPENLVLLVECGIPGTTANCLDDSIVIRNPRNHHLPYDCTNKGLGGSTQTWGGRCVMYDEVDFLPHGPVTDECTWSLEFLGGVQPFLDRAGEYFQSGGPDFDVTTRSDLPQAPIAEHFKSDILTDRRLERWSSPTRFGREYGRELKNSSSIHVLRGYRAIAFSEPQADSHIESMELRPLAGGASASVNAAKFVISAGGQESTRLLLQSPQVFKNIGGPPQSLGLYYQGHISGKIAFVKFHGDPDKTDYGFMIDAEGVYCRRRFQYTKNALVDHDLLNIAFWLDNPPVYDPSHGNGILSFIYVMMIMPGLKRWLLPPAIARSLTAGKTFALRRHFMNILTGMPSSFLFPAMVFAKRYFPRRKLPGVYLKSRSNRYALHFHSEQVPRSDNRMTLGEDGETLVINYDYSDADINSVIRAHELLDSSLRQQGCGELEYLYDSEQLPEAIRDMSMDGLHQVGTTRIASSPQDGVVDSNLLVWGTRNLYVCSSSVFPTSSQANPTFFLGACAARLAAHLTKSDNSTTNR